MNTSTKVVLASMAGAKYLFTVLGGLLMPLWVGNLFMGLGFVGPWGIFAIAFADPPKWLMLLLLGIVGVLLLGFLIYLILLLADRCEGRVFPTVFQIFLLLESLFLLSLGIWSVPCIIYNLIIILLLQSAKGEKNFIRKEQIPKL